MRFQLSKFTTVALLLTITQAAAAHPAVFSGSTLANLFHLLTEPDHLLILGGIGLIAGLLWRIKSKA